jgi:hypothetical protein
VLRVPYTRVLLRPVAALTIPLFNCERNEGIEANVIGALCKRPGKARVAYIHASATHKGVIARDARCGLVSLFKNVVSLFKDTSGFLSPREVSMTDNHQPAQCRYRASERVSDEEPMVGVLIDLSILSSFDAFQMNRSQTHSGAHSIIGYWFNRRLHPYAFALEASNHN